MTISILFSMFAACTPTTDDSENDDGSNTDETGDSDNQPEEWSPIGTGDGSKDSVTWTYIIGDDEKMDDPRDLGFDSDGRLWVANRDDDKTFIVTDPGTDDQDYERREDGYSEHFMEEVSGIAFDDDGQFATCGESDNTYNDQGNGNGYMGPVLWSTDLNIFAEADPLGLGSHLDMSHESPLCVGIAWEGDNAYWVFDGDNDALVRHDFQSDHGAGMDDHSDGIVWRLTEPEVERVEEAPGHIVIDRDARRLYAADTGGGRIVWVDIDSGSEGDSLRANDFGVESMEWEGADWGELVTDLDDPGALAMYDDRLIVGEWATGMLIEYDLEGNKLRELETGFGEESLYGIEIGPDGLLWVIDVNRGVYRIDPA